MKVTVATESGGVFTLDVSLELTLGDLKAILEIEVERMPQEMVLLHNLQSMTDEGKTLGEYNVEDGDVLQLTFPYIPPSGSSDPPLTTHPPPVAQPPPVVLPNIDWASVQPPTAPQAVLPNIDWASVQPPTAPQAVLPNIDWGSIDVNRSVLPQSARQQADPGDPEAVRRHFLNNPSELAVLRQQNPPLAQALESGDLELFRRTMERQLQAVREEERRRIRILTADPMDPENQELIARDIQQKNIEENMQAAIEFTPESFSNVVMLYVVIKVNGVAVKALVDSGAAGTIMSDSCAKKCGIMRLVDRRFAGMAIGVGTQKIIGKVHLGTIQIGEDFLTSSFKVLEGQTEDMLLGLDMLRRHQVNPVHVY
jgi:DNA damage-inducible protein 1